MHSFRFVSRPTTALPLFEQRRNSTTEPVGIVVKGSYLPRVCAGKEDHRPRLLDYFVPQVGNILRLLKIESCRRIKWM
jgi:hypothetical protein